MVRRQLLYLVLFSILSCSKAPETDHKTQYTLNCILQPQQPVRAELSRTFTNPRKPEGPITTARVILSRNQTQGDTMSLGSDQAFTSDLATNRGSNFYIHAELDNQVQLAASTYIPKPLLLEITNSTNNNGRLVYEIRITSDDILAEKLFLRYQAYPKDSSNGDAALTSVELDDYLKASPFFTLPGRSNTTLTFRSDRAISHKFTLMSEEIFNYLKREEVFNPVVDGTPPPITPNNVSGGAGFFGFYDEYIVK